MGEIDYSLSVDTLPAEAWVPQVGDRVRVRLSGECALVGPPDSPAGEEGLVGHSPALNGAVGVVIDPPYLRPHPLMVAQGHVYRVRLDRAVEGYRAYLFAACELERLP